MDVDSSGNIPVQAVLKLIVDQQGSSQVDDVLNKQDQGFSKVEATVGRIGDSLESITRSVAGLAGAASLGAVVDKFIKIETSASNIALATGKVTGGSGTYGGIRQEELGVQSRTGVSTGEQEAALRSLAMSVGLSPRPGQAGMLAEVIAGYSRVTGVSSASLASIVGPMLQAEGRGSSPSATAFTLGEARANLGAFPGSQIEGVLPVVSGLSTSAALGTAQGAGKGVSVGGIASLINTISGPGSVLRQPGLAQQAAEGIGGTLQGAYQNPRVYAFMKMAGIGFKEQQLGFNSPKVQEKIVEEANRQYPGNSEESWKERRLLYLELGQGEAGADALERIESATKGGGIHVATPKMKKEASERHHAQTLTTPEAKLKKVEGGAQNWLFSSPLHEALGAAGLLLGPNLLGKGGSSLAKGLGGLFGGGAEGGAEAGGIGLGDILGGAVTGGVVPTIMSLIDPGGSMDLLGKMTGGGLSGNVSGGSRKAIEQRANAKAVEGVAAAAQKKFGSKWNSATGVKWMERELNSKHSRFDEETRVGIGESETSPHPWAATQLLKSALGTSAANPTNPKATGQSDEAAQFSEAVKRFSEAVDKMSNKGGMRGAAYEALHPSALMGAAAVSSMQSSAPGMMMAALLNRTTLPGPGTTPGEPHMMNVAYPTPPGGSASSGWNSILEKYSGDEYGHKGYGSASQYVAMLAGQNKGGGAQRRTVEADAKKYGIPFNVLWGIYGAESSFGKAASNFGLTGQYPGIGTSGNFNTDARTSAQDLANLAKQMHLHIHVEVGGQKVEQHKTKVGAPRAQLT